MKQTHNWKKSESESPLPYPYYIFVPNAHPPISTSRLVFPPQGAPALALHLKLNWDLHIVSLQLGIAPGIAMNLHFNYVMVTTREIIKQISWVEPHVWVYLIFVVRVLWAVLVYKVWLSVKKSRRTRKCRNQGQFSPPSIFVLIQHTTPFPIEGGENCHWFLTFSDLTRFKWRQPTVRPNTYSNPFHNPNIPITTLPGTIHRSIVTACERLSGFSDRSRRDQFITWMRERLINKNNKYSLICVRITLKPVCEILFQLKSRIIKHCQRHNS